MAQTKSILLLVEIDEWSGVSLRYFERRSMACAREPSSSLQYQYLLCFYLLIRNDMLPTCSMVVLIHCYHEKKMDGEDCFNAQEFLCGKTSETAFHRQLIGRRYLRHTNCATHMTVPQALMSIVAPSREIHWTQLKRNIRPALLPFLKKR